MEKEKSIFEELFEEISNEKEEILVTLEFQKSSGDRNWDEKRMNQLILPPTIVKKREIVGTKANFYLKNFQDIQKAKNSLEPNVPIVDQIHLTNGNGEKTGESLEMYKRLSFISKLTALESFARDVSKIVSPELKKKIQERLILEGDKDVKDKKLERLPGWWREKILQY